MGRGNGEGGVGFPVPATVGGAAGSEDVGVVSEPVQQRGGEFSIAEDLYPFAEGKVGGDQCRPPFVPLRQQIEE